MSVLGPIASAGNKFTDPEAKRTMFAIARGAETITVFALKEGVRCHESEKTKNDLLHCMIVELIDDFFAENPAAAGSDKVDTSEADEVIDAIAKTVAELTSQQDRVIRQQVIEQLMQQIMHYDGEFRQEEATSSVASHAKH